MNAAEAHKVDAKLADLGTSSTPGDKEKDELNKLRYLADYKRKKTEMSGTSGENIRPSPKYAMKMPPQNIKGKIAIRGAQYANSLIFLVTLQIIDTVKMKIGARENIGPVELARIVAESTAEVVNSPEIAAGMAGSKVLEHIPAKMVRAQGLEGIRGQIAAQVLGVITYVGWSMGAQLYADSVRGMDERPTILQIMTNRELADEVFGRLKRHISGEKYRESFETAIYKGVLTGDGVFFMGFLGVGAEIGTVMFPGVGTAIGILLGGSVSIMAAIAAKTIPADITGPMTDVLANAEKWSGELAGSSERARLTRYWDADGYELMRDAIAGEAEGRGKVADMLLGVYMRNLEFWYMREGVLKALIQEKDFFDTQSFEAYNYVYPGRQLKRIKSNLSDPGFEEIMRMRAKTNLTRDEVSESIDEEIEIMQNALEINERKVRAACSELIKVYASECYYYMGLMSKPSPTVEIERDKVCRINGKIDEVFNPDILSEEIKDIKSDRKYLHRALEIIAGMLPYSFDEKIFLKKLDPSWIDTSNIQHWNGGE